MNTQNPKPKVYAHRGASGLAPENTLEAFRLALELGVDGIEFDIHATVDGLPVISHDRSLKRALGIDRNIDELTLTELRDIAPQVPTLGELLELVGDSTHLDVEAKQAGIEELVLATLARFPRVRWAISCFDWGVLERLRELSADADLWLLTTEVSDALFETAARLNASGIAVLAPAITAAVIERAHKEGLIVMAWTVNDVRDAERLRRWGVDALCTDHPERWLRTPVESKQ